MLNAKISGIASYVPDDVLDNEMLSKMVDTNDEWITTRVGIKERRILKDESKGSSYLGTKAVERLLESTSTKPEEIDLVICATSNPDYRFPPPPRSLHMKPNSPTLMPTTYRLPAPASL